MLKIWIILVSYKILNHLLDTQTIIKKFYFLFSPSIKMSGKSVNFWDKNIDIDYIDVNKILAFKEEL